MWRPYTVSICVENIEAILRELMPVMKFTARMNEGKLKGYDEDDIIQELSILIWEKIRDGKIPSDMKVCDYRFERYCGRMFVNEINGKWRKRINRYKKRVHGITVYHDFSDIADPISHFENIEYRSSLLLDTDSGDVIIEENITLEYAYIPTGEERNSERTISDGRVNSEHHQRQRYQQCTT